MVQNLVFSPLGCNIIFVIVACITWYILLRSLKGVPQFIELLTSQQAEQA
uniref:Uncharacterized protein n=1 Tax=Aegilops tauschii subsp. strangulata TaxID=200361 RepID=A0A453SLX0_AEGTS